MGLGRFPVPLVGWLVGWGGGCWLKRINKQTGPSLLPFSLVTADDEKTPRRAVIGQPAGLRLYHVQGGVTANQPRAEMAQGGDRPRTDAANGSGTPSSGWARCSRPACDWGKLGRTRAVKSGSSARVRIRISLVLRARSRAPRETRPDRHAMGHPPPALPRHTAQREREREREKESGSREREQSRVVEQGRAESWAAERQSGRAEDRREREMRTSGRVDEWTKENTER